MPGEGRLAKRPRYPMPAFMQEALKTAALMDAYKARPPYQQNDYIGWITRAKRPETRQRRIAQMLEELAAGDRYMKMPYRAKRNRSGDQVAPNNGMQTDGASRRR